MYGNAFTHLLHAQKELQTCGFITSVMDIYLKD